MPCQHSHARVFPCLSPRAVTRPASSVTPARTAAPAAPTQRWGVPGPGPGRTRERVWFGCSSSCGRWAKPHHLYVRCIPNPGPFCQLQVGCGSADRLRAGCSACTACFAHSLSLRDMGQCPHACPAPAHPARRTHPMLPQNGHCCEAAFERCACAFHRLETERRVGLGLALGVCAGLREPVPVRAATPLQLWGEALARCGCFHGRPRAESRHAWN